MRNFEVFHSSVTKQDFIFNLLKVAAQRATAYFKPNLLRVY